MIFTEMAVPVVALAVALGVALASRRVVRHPAPASSPTTRFAEVVPAPLRPALDRAGLGEFGPRLVVGWGAGLAGVSVCAGVVSDPQRPVVLFVLGAILVGPVAALFAFRNRRDRLIESALPAALESMARAIRSGATFTQAVGETAQALVGPLRREFTELHRRLILGQGFALVMEQWVDRRPLAGVRLASAALEFSHDAGGARSRALDGVADSLRDQAALESEIAALVSQSRLSALVVALLPVGFVGLSTSIDDAVGAFLFGSPLGLACLAGGLALDAVGFVWMRQMTGSAS